MLTNLIDFTFLYLVLALRALHISSSSCTTGSLQPHR